VLGGSAREAGALSRLVAAPVTLVQPNADLPRLEKAYCRTEPAATSGASLVADDPLAYVRRLDAAAAERIVVPDADPSTIVGSRLLTAEFFAAAARALGRDNPVGYLMAALGETASTVSPPEADYYASVLLAAREAFAGCELLPLDRVWLVCTARPFTVEPEALAARLKTRGVMLRRPIDEWLSDALQPRRRDVLKRAVDEATRAGARANTALEPSAPLSALAFSLARFEARAFSLARPLRRAGWPAASVVALVALVAAAFAVRRSARSAAAGLAIGAAGGAGMAATIVAMTAYQSGYGLLYHRVGLLAAAYMTGLGVGAHAAERLAARPASRPERLLAGSLAAGAGVLWAVVLVLPAAVGALPEPAAAALYFVVLALYAAAAGGAAQLAAVVKQRERGVEAGRASGWMRAVDHAASAAAALTVGLFFIPAIGLPGATALAALLLSLTGFAWIVRARRAG